MVGGIQYPEWVESVQAASVLHTNWGSYMIKKGFLHTPHNAKQQIDQLRPLAFAAEP